MASTTWSPRPITNRRSWLLTNGEVVEEPALEESPSGRKVRIAGTKVSFFAKDEPKLLLQSVEQAASDRGAKVWMALGRPSERQYHSVQLLGFAPTPSVNPDLHIIHRPDQYRARTNLFWTFRHASLPIEATLKLSITATRHGAANPQAIEAMLHMPDTQPNTGDLWMNPKWYTEDEEGFAGLPGNANLGFSAQQRVREFLRDHPPAWDTTVLGDTHYESEQKAAKALLDKVARIDQFDTITIPDLRDPDHPQWLELELFETNVTQAFTQELIDYLDSAPAVEDAAKHYAAMVKALRTAGLVMEERTENDFQRVLAGADHVLNVDIGPTAERDDEEDSHHSLTVHLATGTFIVNCSLHVVNRNDVAHAWEQALVVAELTGKKDELLAYAAKYSEDAAKRRTEEILAERGATR